MTRNNPTTGTAAARPPTRLAAAAATPYAEMIEGQALRPRVLQYRGRRYSLRLERIFWSRLERMAQERGQRLGQLVGELAEQEKEGSGSLASRLRVACLLHAEAVEAGGEDAKGASSFLATFDAAPSPGLIITAQQDIVRMNRALVDWLGASNARIIGQRLGDAFEIRARPPFSVTWESLRQGIASRAVVQLVRRVPGQVLIRRGRVIALPQLAPGAWYALLWVEK